MTTGTKALTLLMLMGACAPADGPRTAVDSSAADTALEERVRRRLDGLDATTSIYAKHIPSGREIAIRADEPMNPLSVIKIPIMVLAFRDAEAGRFDMSARYALREEDLRRGSGILKEFRVGLQPTHRDLITQMIITSDNTATDIMIRMLGMDRVNAMLAQLGYVETRLKQTTGRLFRETWIRQDSANNAMTDREIYERGFPSGEGAAAMMFEIEGDSTVWLGRTTAREMGRLVEQMLNQELTSEESVEAMFDILDDQMYNSRLPQRVRFRARIAHKTGDWPPYAGNDVGVLFYEGGPTVISAFTNQNRGDFFELEAALGLIAEDILSEWN